MTINKDKIIFKKWVSNKCCGGVEKLETSFTAGWDVKWCTLSGIQYGGSSKSLIQESLKKASAQKQ